MPIADGAVFAGYTIVRLLGTGGMGEVYLVQHPRLPRREALKVLPANVSADPEYRQRFAREADIAASPMASPHRGCPRSRRARRSTLDRDGLRRRHRCRPTNAGPMPRVTALFSGRS
jgi:hypothetical protein